MANDKRGKAHSTEVALLRCIACREHGVPDGSQLGVCLKCEAPQVSEWAAGELRKLNRRLRAVEEAARYIDGPIR